MKKKKEKGWLEKQQKNKKRKKWIKNMIKYCIDPMDKD
jgi:hypothetical protein